MLTSTTMAATAEAEPTTTTRSRSDTRPISPAPSNNNNNNNSPPKPDDFPEDINDSSAPREYTPPTDVVTTIRQNNTFDIEYLQSRGPTLMPATNWSNSVAAPNTAQVSVKKIWEEKQKISLSRERRATRILGIVMGVFVACWWVSIEWVSFSSFALVLYHLPQSLKAKMSKITIYMISSHAHSVISLKSIKGKRQKYQLNRFALKNASLILNFVSRFFVCEYFIQWNTKTMWRNWKAPEKKWEGSVSTVWKEGVAYFISQMSS